MTLGNTELSDGQLLPDIAVAHRFLDLLAPSETRFTFQTVGEASNLDAASKHKLNRVFHASLADIKLDLVKLNAAGAGVFVTINQTDLSGRKGENITRVRAVFVDADGTDHRCLERFPLQPNLAVVTSPRGFHAYWLVDDLNLGEFKTVQQALARLMGTDPSVCDLPRLVRLPGFIHRKKPETPFLSKLHVTERDGRIYAAHEIKGALDQVAPSKPHRDLTADVLNGISASPNMAEGFPDGHRTHELTRRAGYCLGPLGMTAAQAIEACLKWNDFNRPPLPTEKVEATVRSIAKSESKKIAKEPTATSPSPASAIATIDQSAFYRLAALSAVDYDRVRKDEAEKLGIRVTTLDEEVARLRPNAEDEVGAGRPLSFSPIDPWQEIVYGTALLEELTKVIRRYVALTDDLRLAVALWVLHAHAIRASLISPRLAITSPEKRCGKSTLLRVISELVPKRIWAANITSAAIFRTVEASTPTLLIDEADSFLKDNEELRGILNAGHQSGTDIVRLTGDDHEPRLFSAFCPTAIAAIGRLPSTIEDRSIAITMMRRRPEERVERFRLDQTEMFAPLRQKSARWAIDNEDCLRSADPHVPEELHDRAADNWRPLLAIADLCGSEWSKTARAAAIRISGGDDAVQGSLGTLLLNDIRNHFDTLQSENISSENLVDHLTSLQERPWRTINKGGTPLNQNRMARMLKEFGVVSNTVRLNAKETKKGYCKDQFADAFVRYLPPKA